MYVWYCGLLQISVFILRTYFSVQATLLISICVVQFENRGINFF
jgi:hypothetical protein